jgi:hypothetical protein
VRIVAYFESQEQKTAKISSGPLRLVGIAPFVREPLIRNVALRCQH